MAPAPRAAAGFALAALALLPASACARRAPRPNVIFFLVDTLRRDHLGAYGFRGEISPHLDRLASESFVFTNGFANAPWTPPSMGTLFTSLYPQVHGLNRFDNQRFLDPKTGELRASVLPEDAVTLAEVLRDAGFATAAFVANPWLVASHGLAQGFQVYDDVDVGKRTPATLLTVAARDWLAGGSPTEPFFLYLHFMDVHEPYDAPLEDFTALQLEPSPGDELTDAEMPADYMEVRPPWADATARRKVAYWRARYAAGVRQWDRRVADFIEELRTSGLLDRSYLIVASDHGEELFEHRGWGHGQSLFDEQLRIPLLIRPPRGLPARHSIEPVVRLIDVMPTILSLVDVAPPLGLQGDDVSGLLAGKPLVGDAPVFSTGIVGKPRSFAIRTERYKLVLNRESGATSLYDLLGEPAERDDVSREHPEVVARLRERLRVHIETSMAGRVLTPQSTTVPPRVRERLEALGYLE